MQFERRNAKLLLRHIVMTCLLFASWQAFGAAPAAGLGSLSGTVVGSDGKPVSGALVAAVPGQMDHPAATTLSNADGTFRFEGLAPGGYGLTATAPGQTAWYLGDLAVVQDKELGGLKMLLGGNGFTIHGTVSDDEGNPLSGAVVLAGRQSDVYGDVFQVNTDEHGTYSVKLPLAAYTVSAQHPGYEVNSRLVPTSEDQTLDLQILSIAKATAPPPDEVVDWIRANAIKITTPEAGHGFSDMEPLKKVVGDARIVALGEATHGTREFFQFKHRMLEFLVSEMGFTVFAIEANFPESLAVNDYVLNGKGDPAKALSGMYFWTWNTEEVLDMIRWIRKYNEDPAHLKKVKFCGFDMQFAQKAIPYVGNYLMQVDPDFAPKAEAALKPLFRTLTYPRLSEERRKATAEAIADVLKRFDEKRKEYVARSSEEAWTLARQHAVIIRQAEAFYGNASGADNVRDYAMAQNLKWILAHEGPGTRIVAWAHNAHVSFDHNSLVPQPMGSWLKKDLGKDFLAIGFAFDQGSFRAMDSESANNLRGFTVGPSRGGSLNAALAMAGIPFFVLDLRQVPASGPVGSWWQAEHKERSIGARFDESSQDSSWLPAVSPKEYDALFFAERTTAARANQPGQGGGAPASPKKLAIAPANLDLAQGEIGQVPPGWSLPQHCADLGYEAKMAEDGQGQGRRCIVLSGNQDSSATVMQKFDAKPYRGKRVRFQASVRVDLAEEGDWAGLWVRVDLKKGVGFFDTMKDRPIKSNEWNVYEVEGDVASDAEAINIGLLLSGGDKAWMSGAKFEIVGDAAPTKR